MGARFQRDVDRRARQILVAGGPERHHEKARALEAALVEAHPAVPDHRRALAQTYGNLGVSLRRSLRGYLEKQPLPAKRFFRSLMRDPRVMKLLDEAIAVVRRWREEHHKGDRSAFDRMTRMHSRSFAEGEARKLHDLLPHSGARRSVVH